MTLLNLQKIIRNRTVCIMAHGNSISELEISICDFKNYDICWISLGLFPIMEQFILSKIDKRLDIVFDCATVPESQQLHYERNIRIPRLEEFLSRPDNNMWITSYGQIRDLIIPKVPDWQIRFKEKILQVDSLFPLNNIPYYMSVPNSITLMIACAMAGKAKKIILFGFDGYKGDMDCSSYYKPELAKKEWIDAYGNVPNFGLQRDSNSFEVHFPKIYEEYCSLFGRISIINCSSNSKITVIPTISYTNLKEEL